MQLGEGERLHEQRRKRFWWTLGIIAAASMPLGFAAGYASATQQSDVGVLWRTMPDGLAFAVVLGGLVLFTVACGYFMKAIDEVELLDNLWGSTAAYYVYATLFPAWWALAEAGVVGKPNGWVIYAVALAGGGLLYLWRKYRAR